MQSNVIPLHPAGNYYDRLGSSMEDKLFFTDRLPSDVTVFADYGCGDGRVLTELATRRDVRHSIGFDLNAEVLPAGPHANSTYTSSLQLFALAIMRQKRLGRKVCLILSSVVHEVLSQGTSWFKFWADIRHLGCDYVVIRDMACSIDAKTQPPVANPTADDRLAASLLYNVEEVGTFTSQAELLEALLKYRYVEDRDRELQESYFALAAEQWLNLTNVGSGYQITHFDHHSVPWHRANWMRDFGLDIEDATHIKIILKKV